MLPVFFRDYALDSASRYTVQLGYLPEFHSSLAQISNRDDLLSSKFGESIIFTAPRFWVDRPILSYLIVNIVLICSKKKMGRIYANWIIATVQTMQAMLDWAIMQFVGKAMGGCDLAIDAQTTVVPIEMTLPLPAITGPADIYPRPKSYLCAVMSEPGAVASYKSRWLPHDVPMPDVTFFMYGRLLPASAMAVAVGNFVRGSVRGMIAHVMRSFQRLTMPRDCFRNRRGSLFQWSSIIAQMFRAWYFQPAFSLEAG